jgi:phosphotransferase system enzyme I (PtsI)
LIEEFIDAHLLMLEDRALSEAPVELIQARGISAEWALQLQRNALVRVFEDIPDPYLRTRKDDVDHVVTTIQKLLHNERGTPVDNLTDQIVIAEDLTPADIILLHHHGAIGFVTEYGGPMSHMAILARSLSMPAVVGARGSTKCLTHGETLILDSNDGVVLAGFDALIRRQYDRALVSEKNRATRLRRLRRQPAITKDGQRVKLFANIELADDVAAACENGAEGIGLYRTEFLYMNRREPPSEDEHYAAYCSVIEGLHGLPVTIRTLDLGADKQLESGDTIASVNPALGLRAIRLCLKEPQLFRPQIRAILRASSLGPVRIMLPMLTNVWEVMQARAVIEDMMRELDIQGIAYAPDVPIGGMIEVPAAALAAASFARHLDFLSIGTNDLIQYALAIDRVDDEVNYLYDPTHPAVLKLLQTTIAAGQRANVEVGMCGEMAGDERFIPILIGMGLRSLSMHPDALSRVKAVIRRANAKTLGKRVDNFMRDVDSMDSTEDVIDLI